MECIRPVSNLPANKINSLEFVCHGGQIRDLSPSSTVRSRTAIIRAYIWTRLMKKRSIHFFSYPKSKTNKLIGDGSRSTELNFSFACAAARASSLWQTLGSTYLCHFFGCSTCVFVNYCRYFSKNAGRGISITHTNVKVFSCEVCSKSTISQKSYGGTYHSNIIGTD